MVLLIIDKILIVYPALDTLERRNKLAQLINTQHAGRRSREAVVSLV